MPRKKQKKEENGLERKSLRVATISAVAAIVAIFVGIGTSVWVVRRSEELARDTGQFDRPDIAIFFFDSPAQREQETRLFYALPHADSSLVVARVQVQVKNTGQKTLRNPVVSYRYPLVFGRQVLTNAGEMKAKGVHAKDAAVSLDTVGNVYQVSYSLPDLNPGQTAGIEDPIVLESTAFSDTMSIGRLPVAYSVQYAVLFDVAASGEDTGFRTQQASIVVVAARTRSELRKSFSRSISYEAGSRRKEMSFWDYLLLLIRNPTERAVLVFPKLMRTETPAGVVYLPSAESDVVEHVEYHPYAWHLLF